MYRAQSSSSAASIIGRTVVLVGCFLWCQLAGAQTSSRSSDKGAASSNASDKVDGKKDFLARAVRFSGSIRERWEATDGPFSVTPADSYLISQIRLGVTVQPVTWLKFKAEAQDARVLFYKTVPSNSFSNPFDLHQAWLAIGKSEGNGILAKVGRQDIVIGSGHLLASSDAWWAYTARNFDVAYGSWQTNSFKSELVAGSVVLMNPNGIDQHKPGDHIYASYNSFGHILPGASLEPYFIARTLEGVKSKDGQLGSMDTLAVGGRIVGKVFTALDYSFEAVHEYGSYSNDELDASGLLAGAGWMFGSSHWKPRLSSDYTYGSGDDGRKNGKRETFDNMFGYNFPMNSLTGQFGWRNLKDVRAGAEFLPVQKLKIKLDCRNFWLVNQADGLYNPAGTRTVFNPSATSTHVGESIEMMATANFSKKTVVGFGVGSLFPGEYLKQSQKDEPFIYPYVYLSRSF
jgi:hypothetical protein